MKRHSFLLLDLCRSPELWCSIYCSCIGGRKSSICLPAGYTSVTILEQIDWKLFWWGPRDDKISLDCAHTLAGPEFCWENHLGILALKSTSMSCQKNADSKQSKQEKIIKHFILCFWKHKDEKKLAIWIWQYVNMWQYVTDNMNRLKEIKILVDKLKSQMGWI